ncbi:hypothetical protein [Streptomyces sp. WZ-12]|uniref:hypothetical protein n=1 Tax=Streptomyces sp. WZ-12 TaxID=3030210 RepID=UPI0023814232|nr:hypothetical protein [Streptomyces sp. WZ-12]
MPSVMGLLEEREAVARVRAEELRVELERIAAELADAEAVLERRVIARTELAEALAGEGEEAQAPDAGVCEAPSVSEKAPAPVVGPSCHAGTRRRRWTRSRWTTGGRRRVYTRVCEWGMIAPIWFRFLP